METKKPTRMQEVMRERNISCRDISAHTGTNLALCNYITRGMAKFPTEEEFMKCCELLQCSPSDIYPKRTIQVYYPKTEPQKPRKNRDTYGNPSVRVKAEYVKLIKDSGANVAEFVGRAVERLLVEEGLMSLYESGQDADGDVRQEEDS